MKKKGDLRHPFIDSAAVKKFTRKGQAVVVKPLKRQQPHSTRKGQAGVVEPLKRQQPRATRKGTL